MPDPMQDQIDDHLFDDYDDDLDEEFDPEDECMLGPDGQCGAAGSEWCDFECPLRDSEFFAGSKAWREKHKRGRKP